MDLQPPLVFPILFVSGKATDLDCIENTIQQLAVLEENGLMMGPNHIAINCKAVICYSPAKSQIKQTKGT